ncbi:MAG: hypothetical protein SGPRY_014769, partial [Prymnesium sp.]
MQAERDEAESALRRLQLSQVATSDPRAEATPPQTEPIPSPGCSPFEREGEAPLTLTSLGGATEQGSALSAARASLERELLAKTALIERLKAQVRAHMEEQQMLTRQLTEQESPTSPCVLYSPAHTVHGLGRLRTASVNQTTPYALYSPAHTVHGLGRLPLSCGALWLNTALNAIPTLLHPPIPWVAILRGLPPSIGSALKLSRGGKGLEGQVRSKVMSVVSEVIDTQVRFSPALCFGAGCAPLAQLEGQREKRKAHHEEVVRASSHDAKIALAAAEEEQACALASFLNSCSAHLGSAKAALTDTIRYLSEERSRLEAKLGDVKERMHEAAISHSRELQ